MSRIRLYPYNIGSKSARLLGEQLDALGHDAVRVRTNGAYRHRPTHKLVNWGASAMPRWGTPVALGALLNKLPNVAAATDKLETFRRLSTVPGVVVPDWTTSMATARTWLTQPKYPGLKNAVVCRTLTRAAEGRGIVLADTPDNVVAAPLYTRYTPQSKEFRIHASAHHGVIDVQEKRKRAGMELTDANRYIRNHGAGWVFCHADITLPAGGEDMAQLAVAGLGLDFGAVDMGYHPNHGWCVYEINTAPGIEGQTVRKYAEFITRVYG